MSNSLLEFAAYQQARGREVTPELLQVGREIEEKKWYAAMYKQRPLRCKLGLHRRIQGLGGGYPLTCTICYRHKV